MPAIMDDDKWKIIDTHVSSMMDWTSGVNPNSLNAQSAGGQRQGHIHRRSEPDVVMIRMAQQSRKNNQLPVPQSAPVQPGTFTLDWNSKPKKKLPSCEDEPTEDIDIFPETRDLIQFPELESFAPKMQELKPTNKPDVGNVNSHRLLVNSVTNRKNGLGMLVNHTEHERPGFKGADGLPKPPPYPWAMGNGSVNHTRHHEPIKSFNTPLNLAPETPFNINQFSTIKSPPSSNHYGYASPRSNRRSSVPGNQLDPRAHSASPNITRRSTSISATVQRRRTQDNFSFMPSVMADPEVNAIPNRSSNTVGPTPRGPLFDAITPPEATITSFSSNKKADDIEYTKALLQHQRDRMQRLKKELDAQAELLLSLSSTVKEKEKEVFDRRNENISTCMPTLNDVTKLREINRQMEIACNCMIKEVEMVSKSGNSVSGNFHENISRRSLTSGMKKKHALLVENDLPSPPLPPPPIPPPVENEEEPKWSCKWCTFLNHAALNKCEMCDYKRNHVPAAS